MSELTLLGVGAAPAAAGGGITLENTYQYSQALAADWTQTGVTDMVVDDVIVLAFQGDTTAAIVFANLASEGWTIMNTSWNASGYGCMCYRVVDSGFVSAQEFPLNEPWGTAVSNQGAIIAMRFSGINTTTPESTTAGVNLTGSTSTPTTSSYTSGDNDALHVAVCGRDGNETFSSADSPFTLQVQQQRTNNATLAFATYQESGSPSARTCTFNASGAAVFGVGHGSFIPA